MILEAIWELLRIILMECYSSIFDFDYNEGYLYLLESSFLSSLEIPQQKSQCSLLFSIVKSVNFLWLWLSVCHEYREIKHVIKAWEVTITFKCGTHLTFNAIRVLKKHVLTLCLITVLITRRVFIRKSLSITEKNKTRKIYVISYRIIFYFEYDKNSTES